MSDDQENGERQQMNAGDIHPTCEET